MYYVNPIMNNKRKRPNFASEYNGSYSCRPEAEHAGKDSGRSPVIMWNTFITRWTNPG